MENYTIVEIDKIGNLISNDFTYNSSILLTLFLIKSINKELAKTNKAFRLFLVKLDNHGEYPAIGVQYFDYKEDQVEEIEIVTIDMINTCLDQLSVLDFVNFVNEEEHTFIKSEITHYNNEKWIARGYLE